MSRKLLALTMALAAGGLALVFGLSEPPVVYARSVSEFLVQPIRDAPVRVKGMLASGSLCRVLDPCEYRFRLTERPWTPAAPSLAVSYRSCVVPDTFVSVPGLDVEVDIRGELCATCHVLEASSIMVKCPTKYEMGRYPARRPEVPLCRQ